MKSMKELWQQRNRLIDIVENDERNGKRCRMDGGYFVPNKRGSILTKRICTAYLNAKKGLVHKFIELGLFTEADITSEFIVYNGVKYPEGIKAIDYGKAFYKYQDLKVN